MSPFYNIVLEKSLTTFNQLEMKPDGFNSATNHMIYLLPIGGCNVTITGNTIVCGNFVSGITFSISSISSTGCSYTYQWWYSNELSVEFILVGETGSTYTTVFPHPFHNYSYFLIVTCEEGGSCRSNKLQMIITNPLLVSVTITKTPVSCEGEEITFTATALNGGSNPTYEWHLFRDPLDTIVGTNSSTYSSSVLQLNDVIYCIVTNTTDICTVGNPALSDPIIITFLIPVIPIITIESDPLSVLMPCSANPDDEFQTDLCKICYICSGETITFTPTTNITDPIPTLLYYWHRVRVETDIVVSTNEIYVGNDFENGDEVYCVLSGTTDCRYIFPATSDTIFINVASKIIPLIEINDPGKLCEGVSVLLTTSSYGGINPSYQWYYWEVDNISPYWNLIVGETSSSLLFSSVWFDLRLKVIMTSYSKCCISPCTAEDTINLDVSVNVIASVEITPIETICDGEEITYTAIPTNGGTPTYKWYILNDDAIWIEQVGEISDTFTWTPKGYDDWVKVEMTSSLDCCYPKPALFIIFQDVSPIENVSIEIESVPTSVLSSFPSRWECGPVISSQSVLFIITDYSGTSCNQDSIVTWYLNDIEVQSTPLIDINGQLATYILVSPVNGDYVYCKLTTECPCSTGSPASSKTIYIIVEDPINVTVRIFAWSTTACEDDELCFSGILYGFTEPSTYQWQDNNNDIPGATDYLEYCTNILTVGQHIITLVVTNYGVEYTSNSILVTIFARSSATATIGVNPVGIVGEGITEPFTYCDDSVLTFYIASSTDLGPLSSPHYTKWEYYHESAWHTIIEGDNIWSINKINGWPIVVYSFFDDNDQVKVTINSSIRCKNPAIARITIHVVPNVMPLVSISCAPSIPPVDSNPDPCCIQKAMTFSANPITAPGLYPTYDWYVSGYNGIKHTGDSWSNVTFPGYYGKTVTDLDGNVYDTIIVGTQIWMVQNLATSKYNDGTDIPQVNDGTEWAELTTPGLCVYNNDWSGENYFTYGLLYNAYAINTGKLAPDGWRVATQDDWDTLIAYYGSYTVAGGLMKEHDTSHWTLPNIAQDNYPKMQLRPGGMRFSDGSYIDIHDKGYWWVREPSLNYFLMLEHSSEKAISSSPIGETYYNRGLSVVCVRDITYNITVKMHSSLPCVGDGIGTLQITKCKVWLVGDITGFSLFCNVSTPVTILETITILIKPPNNYPLGHIQEILTISPDKLGHYDTRDYNIKDLEIGGEYVIELRVNNYISQSVFKYMQLGENIQNFSLEQKAGAFLFEVTNRNMLNIPYVWFSLMPWLIWEHYKMSPCRVNARMITPLIDGTSWLIGAANNDNGHLDSTVYTSVDYNGPWISAFPQEQTTCAFTSTNPRREHIYVTDLSLVETDDAIGHYTFYIYNQEERWPNWWWAGVNNFIYYDYGVFGWGYSDYDNMELVRVHRNGELMRTANARVRTLGPVMALPTSEPYVPTSNLNGYNWYEVYEINYNVSSGTCFTQLNSQINDHWYGNLPDWRNVDGTYHNQSPPWARFTYDIDESNPLLVHFHNKCVRWKLTRCTWYFGDGSGLDSDIPSETYDAITSAGPNHTYISSGTYSVELSVYADGSSSINHTFSLNITI